MNNNYAIPVALFIFILFTGCAQVKEVSKTIWGSSTRVLNKERENAIKKTYYCDFDACFDTILSLARNENVQEPQSGKKYFDVFMKDRIKSFIVVLGIEGNVNTTEVGIFFAKKAVNLYAIEVSSLSSSAKERVAEAIFNELSLHFESM